jgi:3-hydroxyisobutyrate dehydrogenase-like beta-hydroxyacid dehydrogenase
VVKDIKIAPNLAREIGVETPLCRLTSELWGGARDAVGPAADFSAFYKHAAAR